ncbi:hypothetical protein CDAR_126511 [Caerostris darwini]|uniref:Uncharacterized protein n=1 Tax=Caerostris darwini TaxID=1538125 RepID=A0AAV4R648_9ARAC|nr:hypothetical protein CDAR_126511 [Caerostris darwini]
MKYYDRNTNFIFILSSATNKNHKPSYPAIINDATIISLLSASIDAIFHCRTTKGGSTTKQFNLFQLFTTDRQNRGSRLVPPTQKTSPHFLWKRKKKSCPKSGKIAQIRTPNDETPGDVWVKFLLCY